MDAGPLRLSRKNHMEQGSQGRKFCRVATPHQKEHQQVLPQDRQNPQGPYDPTMEKFQVHQNPFQRMQRGGGAAWKEDERHLCQAPLTRVRQVSMTKPVNPPNSPNVGTSTSWYLSI
jgi:hypothetical protein